MRRMLGKISTNINARMIANGVEKIPSPAVIEYALKIVVNTFSIIFLTLLGGLLTGVFIKTLVVLCTFGIIRFISGGYHLKSGVVCVLVSTGLMVGIAHLSLSGTLTH